ncbi:MAG: methylglyoxal synthase [Chloroflexota bacterium]
MAERSRPMQATKRIALVAHDNKKDDLLAWVKFNKESLTWHRLCATGTTGRLVSEILGLEVEQYQSGPLGGDQQIGSKISEGYIDVLIFFWDPLEAQPHDPDVRALLRLAVVWNIPVATNRASADFIFSSPLMTTRYERITPDFEAYRQRLAGRFGQGNDTHSD